MRYGLMLCTDQGHRDVLAAVWKAALQSRGEMYAKQFCLNQPGCKGKTPLMLACKNGCAVVPGLGPSLLFLARCTLCPLG